MQYLKSYLNRITERGNAGLAESISATAEEVGGKYLKNFSFTSHEIGLLFGNVQSGKTGQMFGIICKATDLGFPVFVLLTTDNVVLQQQTLERVKADYGQISLVRQALCAAILFLSLTMRQMLLLSIHLSTKKDSHLSTNIWIPSAAVLQVACTCR